MVAVIIPLYKESPSGYDLISLTQCFKVLSNFTIIAVKPQGLNLKNYPFPFTEVISFEDKSFSSIASYNRLLMSAEFYKRFIEYKYILIHQTDAFVFTNELEEWCLKGYDYIGAPWLVEKESVKRKIKRVFYQLMNKQKLYLLDNKVGNGGFSLRRTAVFANYCREMSVEIERYLSQEGSIFNEDVFWSLEVNRKGGSLRIPNFTEAVFFSMENQIPYSMLLRRNSLPFGCHAWEKNVEFYHPIFHQYGYEI